MAAAAATSQNVAQYVVSREPQSSRDVLQSLSTVSSIRSTSDSFLDENQQLLLPRSEEITVDLYSSMISDSNPRSLPRAKKRSETGRTTSPTSPRGSEATSALSLSSPPDHDGKKRRTNNNSDITFATAAEGEVPKATTSENSASTTDLNDNVVGMSNHQVIGRRDSIQSTASLSVFVNNPEAPLALPRSEELTLDLYATSSLAGSRATSTVDVYTAGNLASNTVGSTACSTAGSTAGSTADLNSSLVDEVAGQHVIGMANENLLAITTPVSCKKVSYVSEVSMENRKSVLLFSPLPVEMSGDAVMLEDMGRDQKDGDDYGDRVEHADSIMVPGGIEQSTEHLGINSQINDHATTITTGEERDSVDVAVPTVLECQAEEMDDNLRAGKHRSRQTEKEKQSDQLEFLEDSDETSDDIAALNRRMARISKAQDKVNSQADEQDEYSDGKHISDASDHGDVSLGHKNSDYLELLDEDLANYLAANKSLVHFAAEKNTTGAENENHIMNEHQKDMSEVESQGELEDVPNIVQGNNTVENVGSENISMGEGNPFHNLVQQMSEYMAEPTNQMNISTERIGQVFLNLNPERGVVHIDETSYTKLEELTSSYKTEIPSNNDEEKSSALHSLVQELSEYMKEPTNEISIVDQDAGYRKPDASNDESDALHSLVHQMSEYMAEPTNQMNISTESAGQVSLSLNPERGVVHIDETSNAELEELTPSDETEIPSNNDEEKSNALHSLVQELSEYMAEPTNEISIVDQDAENEKPDMSDDKTDALHSLVNQMSDYMAENVSELHASAEDAEQDLMNAKKLRDRLHDGEAIGTHNDTEAEALNLSNDNERPKMIDVDKSNAFQNLTDAISDYMSQEEIASSVNTDVNSVKEPIISTNRHATNKEKSNADGYTVIADDNELMDYLAKNMDSQDGGTLIETSQKELIPDYSIPMKRSEEQRGESNSSVDILANLLEEEQLLEEKRAVRCGDDNGPVTAGDGFGETQPTLSEVTAYEDKLIPRHHKSDHKSGKSKRQQIELQDKTTQTIPTDEQRTPPEIVKQRVDMTTQYSIAPPDEEYENLRKMSTSEQVPSPVIANVNIAAKEDPVKEYDGNNVHLDDSNRPKTAKSHKEKHRPKSKHHKRIEPGDTRNHHDNSPSIELEPDVRQSKPRRDNVKQDKEFKYGQEKSELEENIYEMPLSPPPKVIGRSEGRDQPRTSAKRYEPDYRDPHSENLQDLKSSSRKKPDLPPERHNDKINDYLDILEFSPHQPAQENIYDLPMSPLDKNRSAPVNTKQSPAVKVVLRKDSDYLPQEEVDAADLRAAVRRKTPHHSRPKTYVVHHSSDDEHDYEDLKKRNSIMKVQPVKTKTSVQGHSPGVVSARIYNAKLDSQWIRKQQDVTTRTPSVSAILIPDNTTPPHAMTTLTRAVTPAVAGIITVSSPPPPPPSRATPHPMDSKSSAFHITSRATPAPDVININISKVHTSSQFVSPPDNSWTLGRSTFIPSPVNGYTNMGHSSPFMSPKSPPELNSFTYGNRAGTRTPNHSRYINMPPLSPPHENNASYSDGTHLRQTRLTSTMQLQASEPTVDMGWIDPELESAQKESNEYHITMNVKQPMITPLHTTSGMLSPHATPDAIHSRNIMQPNYYHNNNHSQFPVNSSPQECQFVSSLNVTSDSIPQRNHHNSVMMVRPNSAIPRARSRTEADVAFDLQLVRLPEHQNGLELVRTTTTTNRSSAGLLKVVSPPRSMSRGDTENEVGFNLELVKLQGTAASVSRSSTMERSRASDNKIHHEVIQQEVVTPRFRLGQTTSSLPRRVSSGRKDRREFPEHVEDGSGGRALQREERSAGDASYRNTHSTVTVKNVSSISSGGVNDDSYGRDHHRHRSSHHAAEYKHSTPRSAGKESRHRND